jgi:exodeoxyribonuclease VII large subunit
LDNKIEVKNTSLKNLEKLLKSHHYQEILNRGFALLKSKNNEIIFSKTEVKLEDEIIVEMSDGKLQAKII